MRVARIRGRRGGAAKEQLSSYQGYSRAKRWINERRASCSSRVGFSGNRAMTVWRYFHVARPSSALRIVDKNQCSIYCHLFSRSVQPYLTVSFPSFGITTAPFSVSSWIVIPGAGSGLCVMCPGARTAGLGGPCGRIKRKKTRHIEIAALMAMRRVICRFAMAGRIAREISPSVRTEWHLRR